MVVVHSLIAVVALLLPQNAGPDLPPARTYSLAVAGIEFKELVRKIQELVGLPIEIGEGLAAPGNVSLRFRDKRLADVVELLCRAAGAHARWNGRRLLLLPGGDPKIPRADLGPFTIWARLDPPGEEEKGVVLELQALWDAAAAPKWYKVEIDSMNDDRGRDVKIHYPGVGTLISNYHDIVKFNGIRSDEGADDWTRDRFILDGRGAVRKLRSVKGRISFWYPKETRTVRFEAPREDQFKMAGAHRIDLNFFHYQKDDRRWYAQIELSLENVKRNEQHLPIFAMLVTAPVRYVDEAGKVSLGRSRGYGGRNGSVETATGIHFGSEVDWTDPTQRPAVLEADIAVDAWSKTYTFEFRNVPLAPRPRGK